MEPQNPALQAMEPLSLLEGNLSRADSALESTGLNISASTSLTHGREFEGNSALDNIHAALQAFLSVCPKDGGNALAAYSNNHLALVTARQHFDGLVLGDRAHDRAECAEEKSNAEQENNAEPAAEPSAQAPFWEGEGSPAHSNSFNTFNFEKDPNEIEIVEAQQLDTNSDVLEEVQPLQLVESDAPAWPAPDIHSNEPVYNLDDVPGLFSSGYWLMRANETDAREADAHEANEAIACIDESAIPQAEVDEPVVASKRPAEEEESYPPAKPEENAELQPAKKMKRGQHLKGRTDMQENARRGQRYWAGKVIELREEWTRKQKEMQKHEHFQRQRWMCERLRVKPQRECVLLALQIATVDNVIAPFAFSDAHHSLGWTGFWVLNVDFRSRMTAIFPPECKSNTINSTFRRAGLIADGSWDRAWHGLSPFVFARPNV